jgi:hypothetical protein
MLELQDEADFDPTTAMGPAGTAVGFAFGPLTELNPQRFSPYTVR